MVWLWWSALVQLISLALKIAIASLITGMTLSYFDVTLDGMLFSFGFTREEFAAWVQQAVEWMVPNMMLGSFVIVPIWLVIVLLTPSSKKSDH